MSLNILIVDDSLTVYDVLKKSLHLAHVPVGALFHATDGVMALKILGEQMIDLVFADLHMPGMGGIELINTMRERGLLEGTPVVVVSAEGSHQVIDQLIQKGARAFVHKPFSPEEIQSVVADITGACHA